jgi:hypothetical protein
MTNSITISEETINNAIKNAKVSIAFEDNENQKQFYRGVVAAFEELIELNNQDLLK